MGRDRGSSNRASMLSQDVQAARPQGGRVLCNLVANGGSAEHGCFQRAEFVLVTGET